MANTIITKNSSTASAVPTSGDLVQGELAVNVTDKRLFTEDSGGTVVELGTNPSSVTTSSVDINGGTIDGTAIGASTASTGAFTNLSYTGTLTGGAGVVNLGSGQLVKDASGNLGLGVVPSAWDTASSSKAFQFGPNGAGSLYVYSNLTSTLGFNFYRSTVPDDKYLVTGRLALKYTQHYTSGHQWFTAPSGTAGNTISFTQAMTLDASGNLLVGTTSAPSASQSGWRVSYLGAASSSRTTTGVVTHYEFYNPNGRVGYIFTSGTSTGYNTSSDYRLKNITGPITSSGEYIDSLNPVEGTWKADGSAFVGLIAHEVQEASRTTVATGEKDGEEMQGMDYSSAEIIANLIAEIQSLRKRLAAAGIA